MENQALMESSQPTTEELRLETLGSKYRVRCNLQQEILLEERTHAINLALEAFAGELLDDPGCLDVQDSHNTPN